MSNQDQNLDQFSLDIERLSSLVRAFYTHEQAINRLEELAEDQGKPLEQVKIFSASWVGFGLSRIYPQGPWKPTAVNDLMRGIKEISKSATLLSKKTELRLPENETPNQPTEVPLPPQALLEDLTLQQTSFVSFCYGVIGGISQERPILDGSLGSLVELSAMLAPLICIPPQYINAEGFINKPYLEAIAHDLELDVEELKILFEKLGISRQ